MIMLDLCTHLCVTPTPAIVTDGTPLTLDKDLHTSLVGGIPVNQANGGRGLNTLCGMHYNHNAQCTTITCTCSIHCTQYITLILNHVNMYWIRSISFSHEIVCLQLVPYIVYLIVYLRGG